MYRVCYGGSGAGGCWKRGMVDISGSWNVGLQNRVRVEFNCKFPPHCVRALGKLPPQNGPSARHNHLRDLPANQRCPETKPLESRSISCGNRSIGNGSVLLHLTSVLRLPPSPPRQLASHTLCSARAENQRHVVTHCGADQGVGKDHFERRFDCCCRGHHHHTILPLLRHGAGPQCRHGTHLRRPEGPGPHLPEPVWPLPARPQACEEDGRLAQDQGDHPQGPRLDHRRDQGLGSARARWCRFSLGSQMGAYIFCLGSNIKADRMAHSRS